MGCSETSEATPAQTSDAGSDASDVSCQSDPRVDVFTPGLTKVGSYGVKMSLESIDPAPPVRGDNRWTLKVLDPSGNPLTGGKLTVTANMPDHGHGSSVVPTATEPDAAGVSNVSSLYFFMPGVWRVRFDVYNAAGANDAAPIDSVSFFFCIEG